MTRLAALCLVALALAGCAAYSLVKTGTHEIDGVYTVETPIQWSKKTEGKLEIWTVDGVGIEGLYFVKGLRKGETLYRAKPNEKLPKFDPAMKPSEIMEFVIDSMASRGAVDVEGRGLRPWDFGAHPGFRFELSFKTGDGLAFEGVAVGAVIDNELQAVAFTGAAVHYFPKYKDDVETLLRSIKTS